MDKKLERTDQTTAIRFGLRKDRYIIVFLAALNLWFSWLQWGKISSLWGDSPRWLFETYRVFLGDVPFRDVAALYPPLYEYVVAGFYKLFGQTFASAQLLLDILSVALIFSTYALARQFLSRSVSAAIVICLALTGLSNDYAFALYSLNLYSPSACWLRWVSISSWLRY